MDTLPEPKNDQEPEVEAQPKSELKSNTQATMPKRLTALLAVFTLASISGIYAKEGVLFCILTLLMVVAIIGRQRAALYMLQGYTVLQLALVCMLPVILHDPGNLVVGNPSLFSVGGFETKIPDFVIFSILILLSALQLWIAFTSKVKAYFKANINMNIMS